MNHLDKNKFYLNIKKSFNKAAPAYAQNAVLQFEVGQRLIERLDFFTLQPECILDLGIGTGNVTHLLANKYPKAHTIGLDFAESMLQEAKNNESSISLLCADFNHIPLPDNSVDLIFSNFTMQWSENITKLYKECYRVLKTNGLLFFSIPGPETLVELRTALHHVDPQYDHINNFIDMHDLGDILVQNKFAHPVMDNDHFVLTYSNVINMLKDIKIIGANTKLTHNPRASLLGKGKFNSLTSAYEQFRQIDGKYPLTYEIVYGHAFKLAKPPKVKHPELSEVVVPIEKIIRKN